MNARCLSTLILISPIVGLSPVMAESLSEASPQRIVVSATRVETPVDEVGSSVSTVTRQQLARTRITQVSDALQLVPGVTVARNGGAGKLTTVYLRGASAGFTRVMLDGVEMNDPSGIETAYDFAHLNVAGIERIEVLRGPQSTLYGSDAMAGVINIVTKKGAGKPSVHANIEGGAFETFRLGVGVQGSTNAFRYVCDVAYDTTEGISAFDKKDGYTERDGYENYTISTRIGTDLSDTVAVDAILRFVKADSDYDGFDASFSPTEDGRIETEEAFARVAGHATLLEGVWEQEVGVSKSTHRRNFVGTPGVPDERYEGDILAFDWQHNVLLESQTLTLGAEWQEDEAKTTGNPTFDANTAGYYLQDTLSPVEHWHTTLGLRLDDHSEFGSETTYRVASSYLLADLGTRLKASWGTGFKAPSLFQLFASSMFVEGNPELDPQTSKGWDVGFEQALAGGALEVGATYFNLKYEDLISYVFGVGGAPGTYMNANRAESTGFEVYLAAQPVECVNLRVDYTNLDNEDKSGSRRFELRRPEHQVSVAIGVAACDSVDMTLSGTYVGKREDLGDVQLDEYVLLNLAVSHDVSDAVTCYVRVENLLDDDTQQVSTYGTPGIAAYAGVRAAL